MRIAWLALVVVLFVRPPSARADVDMSPLWKVPLSFVLIFDTVFLLHDIGYLMVRGFRGAGGMDDVKPRTIITPAPVSDGQRIGFGLSVAGRF